MKLKNICIIPALEKNIYSNLGDLVNWGDSTLLEWKIAQAKESKIFEEIIISTPSKKIINIAKKNNISFLKRKNNDNLNNLYIGTAKKFNNSRLIFLSTTFPFISPETIKKFVINFTLNKYESGFTYFKQNEYFFYKNKPLNFTLNEKITSRRALPPIEKIVPAVTILNSKSLLERKNIFSNMNYFFKIEWLDSLEINSTKDLNVFNLLIKEYFKKNFK